MVWPEIVDITHAREIQNKDTQNDKTRGKSKKDKCILQSAGSKIDSKT